MDRPASESKNSNFRLKFGLPDSQYIDDEFSCAISKDILLHGRMYIAPLYLCFYSKIFSHRTMEVIPFQYVTAIEKKVRWAHPSRSRRVQLLCVPCSVAGPLEAQALWVGLQCTSPQL